MSYISWVVQEEIGKAIINTRGLANTSSSVVIGSNYIPHPYSYNYQRSKIRLESEMGTIEISPYCIEIFGELDGAAYAFAKHVLSQKFYNANEGVTYSDAILVRRKNGKFSLELGPTGQGIFNPDLWPTFKARVEKLCNDLSAFW